MIISKTHIILYVQDQQRSTNLYTELLQDQPILNVPGMTEFQLSENLVLGLMPNDGIAKIITPSMPHPSTGIGIPKCELYLYVSQIDELFLSCQKLPFQLISPLLDRNWGDRAFYLADHDGHIIAFAEKLSA